MNNIFQNVSFRKPQKSEFNLSHSRKFSFAPGQLYPTLMQEVLPGDIWDYDTNTLVRFQPLLSPVMHLVDVYSYSFFCPARLTMERSKFEVFITGGTNGDGKDPNGVTITIPYCNIGGVPPSSDLRITWQVFGEGTLADFLGIGFAPPTDMGADFIPFNMMPFIAFWKMWCEYFRDPNLHPDYVALYPAIFNGRGDITAALRAAINSVTNPFIWYEVPQVCWEKDYFTSALPFAQRGEPVETPLSGTGTVTYKTQAVVLKPSTAAAGQLRAGTAVNAPMVHAQGVDGAGTNTPAGLDNIQSVNLTTGGFTINSLRLAARLQEWLEKMARGGARYIEQIKQQFGEESSDARLQRVEYLAGGKIPVAISEVLQTSEDGTTTPLAAMAGHGVAAGKVTGWKRKFEEHGFIMSVMFLRPRTAYQNGIPRLFTNRFDKLDWAWPSFAHLGEQEVLSREIYGRLNIVHDEEIFGYQQRYAEYKYIPSTVHGEFKDTLDFWHWGRIFTTRPELTPEFVSCDPDPRIFNVVDTASDPLYAIVSNRISCVRPLPYHAEPSL